jgi:MFS family permease
MSLQLGTAHNGALEEIDRDWLAVIASAVCLTFSVGTITLYSFGVFIHPLASEFHWTRGQLSLAVAIGQYSFAVASLLWGMLTDRFGPRATVLPGVAGLAVGVGSLAFLTPHLWHLYLVFAVIPFLAGAASPLGYAAVLIRSFERRLGLALGLALMGVGLGATILPPLSQALVSGFGWRYAYATLGALTLVITLPAAIVATRHARGPAHRGAGRPLSVLPLVWTRTFLLISCIFVLIGIASVGTLSHLVPMMTDRGFSAAAAARLAGITGFATILSRGSIGSLLDKFHAPYVLCAVCVTGAAACLLLAVTPGGPVSYVAALLLGTVVGAEVDFIAFLVRRYFGRASFGRLYGLAFGLFIFGSGTGPLILGQMFDHLHSYRPGLLCFTILAFVAAATALALPRYDSLTESH